MVSGWQTALGPDTPLEEFKINASRWLMEHSNLKTRTIECADWEKVYAYFRTQL